MVPQWGILPSVDVSPRGCRLGVAHDGLVHGSSTSARPWSPKKEGNQALGRSAGGPTTKIHLVVDALGNPVVFDLSGGEVHDVKKAPDLLEKLPKLGNFTLADKGYDSDPLREQIQQRNSIPVIPGRSLRKQKIEYDRDIYQARHLVENAFCQLKQFRAVATRYDKLTRNFLGMVTLASIMIWLRL